MLARRLVALVAALGLAAAAACGSGDDDAASPSTTAAAGGEAFEVTIEHAFGSTELTEPPERVVTWGWASADAAIALGVVSVAIPFASYGGDDEGMLSWIREAVEAEGGALPTVLPNSESPPYEAIAAARPDVILAPYSGITKEEYDLLAAIAPTVAYPGEAWSTPWREVIQIVGNALGRDGEADQLLEEIDAGIAERAAQHPELDGKTVAMVWDTADTFYVYKPADARVQFVESLGLVSAPSVTQLASDEFTFYYTLSYELLGGLQSDILVNFADTPEASKAFLGSERAQLLPQVRTGAVAEVIGSDLVAAVSPPTALSLSWGVDEYTEILARAAKVAGGGS